MRNRFEWRPLPLVLAVLLAGCHEPAVPPETAAHPAVSVAVPVVRDVTDYSYFTGRTDAEKTVDIRARVSGYLTKILFTPGSEVQEGDSLFEIDPRPYQAELDRAEGELARQQALVQRLIKDQERAQKLPVGTITPQELDKIAADLAEAEAAVRVAAAQVDSAKLDLEFTNIKAPFGGRIGRNMISEGNLVSATSPVAGPLTTIVTMDPMFAYFDCDELKMLEIQKRIREGKMKSARETPGSVEVDMELANEVGFPHKGTLDFVNNRVNPSTGTLQVRAVFPNPLENGVRLISPGLFVRSRLPMGEPHKAVLINERAVQIDQGKKYVYVLGEGDKVVRHDVEIGPRHGGLVEVLTGLGPTERVLVAGTQRVRPGVQVTAKQVSMPGADEVETPEPGPIERESDSAQGKANRR